MVTGGGRGGKHEFNLLRSSQAHMVQHRFIHSTTAVHLLSATLPKGATSVCRDVGS